MARKMFRTWINRSPMLIALLMMILGMACSGQDGAAGPAGAEGPAGSQGPAGVEGPARPAGSAGLDQVSAVGDLTSARGVVSDWAQGWDKKKGTRHWFINGEWSLDCPVACAEAKPEQVEYDMAFAMFKGRSGTSG